MNDLPWTNRNLYKYSWMPPNPKAIVHILHGVFEHGGRYEHVGVYLKKAGIGVVAADHYGHGRSPGRKGYIAHWDDLVEDTHVWIEEVKSQYSHIPHFLLGHSLGGLLAVSYLRKKNPDFRGIILLSAALKLREDLSPILQKLAPVLGNLLPWLKTVRLDATAISRDPKVVTDYINDSLVYTGKVYARTGQQTLQETKDIEIFFPKFYWPLLIMHGSADRLTEPGGSKQLYNKASSTDKTIKIFEGWYHELLNEPDHDGVLGLISDWVSARV